MSKAVFYSAHIWKDTLNVELIVAGKTIKLSDLPTSNELIKELTSLFKRHLPKPEDI